MTDIDSGWSERHCANTDVDFHDSHQIEAAQDLCEGCPFRKPCLQMALDNSEVHGVWGGATEKELRRDQSIDAEGKPFEHKIGRVRCPLCGPRSTKFLKVLEYKRTRTHITCSNCGLKWWIRKVINRKSNNF